MANPHAKWLHHGNRERRNQLFPQLEATPDLTRGEQRLAAEVAIELSEGRNVPLIARRRAFATLTVLADG